MIAARIAAVLGAVAFVLAGAPARRASACGDTSGGGGSSSSSSSSSSGDGGSYESVASTPACVDESDVVGYRTCTQYGAWSTTARLPRVSIDVGMWTSRIDLHGLDVGGSMSHDDGTTYAYRITGSQLGDDADVVGVRSRLLLHHGIGYVGLEGAAGGVAAGDDVTSAPMATVELSSRTTMAAIGGVVAGARVTSGRLAIGGEVLAGLRGVAVTSTSTHGACVDDDVRWSGAPAVELRARGELWLTPWITAGAYLGRDALGGQTSAGLDLGFHLRAFDGR